MKHGRGRTITLWLGVAALPGGLIVLGARLLVAPGARIASRKTMQP